MSASPPAEDPLAWTRRIGMDLIKGRPVSEADRAAYAAHASAVMDRVMAQTPLIAELFKEAPTS